MYVTCLLGGFMLINKIFLLSLISFGVFASSAYGHFYSDRFYIHYDCANGGSYGGYDPRPEKRAPNATLLYGAGMCRIELIKEALDQGANINDTYGNRSALMAAIVARYKYSNDADKCDQTIDFLFEQNIKVDWFTYSCTRYKPEYFDKILNHMKSSSVDTINSYVKMGTEKCQVDLVREIQPYSSFTKSDVIDQALDVIQKYNQKTNDCAKVVRWALDN